MMRIILRLSFSLFALMMASGCASWFGWGKNNENAQAPVEAPAENLTKYSDNPQLGSASYRQYKRMTKSRMEEESDLGSQAGSMWVMDGQMSYLFAQNKTRREGDILNVKMEGAALRQVETKVGVIRKLLKQLEEQEEEMRLEQKRLAEAAARGNREPASTTAAAASPVKPTPEPTKPKQEEKEDLSEVQQIQTRIVERMPDGNYRVKGAQPFMIGKREYKVIATGIIRPEDYNDQGVSSNRLLDPQFDVVSLRRKEALQ